MWQRLDLLSILMSKIWHHSGQTHVIVEHLCIIWCPEACHRIPARNRSKAWFGTIVTPQARTLGSRVSQAHHRFEGLLTISDVVQHGGVCVERWIQKAQRLLPSIESLFIDPIDDGSEDWRTHAGSEDANISACNY